VTAEERMGHERRGDDREGTGGGLAGSGLTTGRMQRWQWWRTVLGHHPTERERSRRTDKQCIITTNQTKARGFLSQTVVLLTTETRPPPPAH
jgi:hypothetical protein